MEEKATKQMDLPNVVLKKIVVEKIHSINSDDLRTLVEILQILDLGKVKTLKNLNEIIQTAVPHLIGEFEKEIGKKPNNTF